MSGGRGWALARWAGRQTGGGRTTLAAMGAALVAAWFARGLPVADAADHALVVAGVALAVGVLVAGFGTAIGAASALASGPELAAVATAPVGRFVVAAGVLLGVAVQAAGAVLLAGWAGALPLLTVAGGERSVERWQPAEAVEGASANRGNPAVRWTSATTPALQARFARVAPTGGPLRIRLRLRIALHAAPESGAAMPAQPVHVSAGPPGGAPAPLPPPRGNPWGPEGLDVEVPRTAVSTAGELMLVLQTDLPGLTVGADPAGVRLARDPAPLLHSYARGAIALLPTVICVAWVAALLSVLCSRGVSLCGALGAAAALALAPLAREALLDLPPPGGLAAALAAMSRAVLAVLPHPSSAVGACLAGEDVGWGAVAWNAVSHLPLGIACVAGSAWLLRRKDL